MYLCSGVITLFILCLINADEAYIEDNSNQETFNDQQRNGDETYKSGQVMRKSGQPTSPASLLMKNQNMSTMKSLKSPPHILRQKKQDEVFYKRDINKMTIHQDPYSFVVSIEVVFTDRKRRFCTGAIIHDKVVLSAAYCFRLDGEECVMPELIASFIILGTKKMYENSQEEYLPIRKVKTHPQYKGWTANVALVYSFSSMTKQRPGLVVHLAKNGDNALASNVTVYSWLPCDKTKKVQGDLSVAGSLIVSGLDLGDNSGVQKSTYQSYRRFINPLQTQKKHTSIYRSESKSHIGIYNRRSILDKSVEEATTELLPNSKNEKFIKCSELQPILESRCEQVIQQEISLRNDRNDLKKILCFIRSGSSLTIEEIGSPLVRDGELVAIALGGTLLDGEDVSIGVNLEYYYQWILENLPP